MSNHCHEHECKHEELKYCKSCKDIYCIVCKKTWEEPCTRMHYSNQYWYHTPFYGNTNPSITWPGNNPLDPSYTTTTSSTAVFSADTCKNHI